MYALHIIMYHMHVSGCIHYHIIKYLYKSECINRVTVNSSEVISLIQG